MRDVAVIGIGQSQFGKFPEKSVADLGKQAVVEAIKDGGIGATDVQVAYTSRLYLEQITGQVILLTKKLLKTQHLMCGLGRGNDPRNFSRK